MAEFDYCVVGAGFAGLTAALRLKQAGHSVIVLEARDRVGGRTFTVTRDDGSWIDQGGAWVGPSQDRIYALMDEFGVKTFKQYNDGDAMMVVDGKQHRYGGTIPWTMSPWAVAESRCGLFELGQMCKSIPLEAPWEAKKAHEVGSDDAGAVAGEEHQVQGGARPARHGDLRLLHVGGLRGVDAVHALSDGIGRRSHLGARRRGRIPGRPGRRRHGCDLPSRSSPSWVTRSSCRSRCATSRRTPTG